MFTELSKVLQPAGNHISNVLKYRESRKALKWELNGTTEPVDWAKRIMERVVDQVPKLAENADCAVINGNPHTTGEYPYHVSGILGKKNLKGHNRLTLFHIYPDGTVTFSNKKLPTVKDTMAGAEASSSAQSGAQVPAHQKASDWEWDEYAQKYKYWDGFKWVWQE